MIRLISLTSPSIVDWLPVYSRCILAQRHEPVVIVSCAHYFSGSPNAVVIDGADVASNRYGTPATSS